MMNSNRIKKILRLFLAVSFILNYATVTLGFAVSHTHEPDFDFHENCPACLWQVQAQDTDASQHEVIRLIQGAQSYFNGMPAACICIFYNSEYDSQNPSRAPPA